MKTRVLIIETFAKSIRTTDNTPLPLYFPSLQKPSTALFFLFSHRFMCHHHKNNKKSCNLLSSLLVVTCDIDIFRSPGAHPLGSLLFRRPSLYVVLLSLLFVLGFCFSALFIDFISCIDGHFAIARFLFAWPFQGGVFMCNWHVHTFILLRASSLICTVDGKYKDRSRRG